MPSTDIGFAELNGTPPTTPETAQAIGRLRDLAQGLRARGLNVRMHDGASMTLRVVNPAARTLNETVSAAVAEDRWWFMWSWDERITTMDDVETAADRVMHVLTPLGAAD